MTTLSLTSTFSALCIVKVKILSISSIFNSLRDCSLIPFSLANSKCLKHASTTVFPVTNKFFLETPSAKRLIADSTVGTKYIKEDTSATRRFTSSGIVISKDLSPAST